MSPIAKHHRVYTTVAAVDCQVLLGGRNLDDKCCDSDMTSPALF